MAQVEAIPEVDAAYRLLREEAGTVTDTGLAVLRVSGPDGADYLQGQVTNDVLALADGEGCYAALLDRKGHLEADLRALRVSAEEILVVCEEVGRETLRRHLDTYRIGRRVEVGDLADELVVVSVIGPAAPSVTGFAGGGEHDHAVAAVGGINEARAVATANGVDLIVPVGDAAAVAAALAAGGAPEVPAEAAEILRVEAGRPRFGRDMDTTVMPQEAGINERAVSFTKGCYIGQETVARLHYKGRPNRHLRRLELSAPAEHGEELRLRDRAVGVVGSACVSPAKGPIALAIVRREAEPGAVLDVGDDGRTATVAAADAG